MLFTDIIGQTEVKEILLNTVKQKKIAHAQLFAGPEGVGKLQMAIAYAQYVNCLQPTETDACGTCTSCVKYNKLSHPDLHFVFPIINKPKDAYCSDYLKQWREFNLLHKYNNLDIWLDFIDAENAQGMIYTREADDLIKKLSLKIYEGKYKVIIIWHPEKMAVEASNKLLKILEEPYENTLFLLVSDRPDDIIQTILSRTQRINFKSIPENEIKIFLQQFNLDPDETNNTAHLAQGSIYKALEIIRTKDEAVFNHDLFKEMMRASYMAKIKQIKAIAESISSIGREKQKKYIEYALNMFREYFISNFEIPEITYLTNRESEFGVRFSPFINERNIIGLFEEFSLAQRHIEQNVNAKIVFFDLCLKLTMLLKK